MLLYTHKYNYEKAYVHGAYQYFSILTIYINNNKMRNNTHYRGCHQSWLCTATHFFEAAHLPQSHNLPMLTATTMPPEPIDKDKVN
jgi:hypothetical protein